MSAVFPGKPPWSPPGPEKTETQSPGRKAPPSSEQYPPGFQVFWSLWFPKHPKSGRYLPDTGRILIRPALFPVLSGQDTASLPESASDRELTSRLEPAFGRGTAFLPDTGCRPPPCFRIRPPLPGSRRTSLLKYILLPNSAPAPQAPPFPPPPSPSGYIPGRWPPWWPPCLPYTFRLLRKYGR